MKDCILYVDCNGYKPLPPGETLRIIGSQFDIESVTDLVSAANVIANRPQIKVLVTNIPHYDLISSFRNQHPAGNTVLVTAMPMQEYSNELNGKEEELLDHIVSNRSLHGWTTHDLRITISKILTEDIFGIEKYLAPLSKIHCEKITSSQERDKLNNRVMEFAQACHLGQHTSRMAFGITEELLMNAIYDAPAAGGVPRFQNIDQTIAVQLDPAEHGKLSFGCDGKLLAISSCDPFGALKKNRVLSYLKKVLKRSSNEGLIDSKKGGAGLGLFKILYSSHGIVCNVECGARTEIMALIDVNEQLRDFSAMARSIHFFNTNKS